MYRMVLTLPLSSDNKKIKLFLQVLGNTSNALRLNYRVIKKKWPSNIFKNIYIPALADGTGRPSKKNNVLLYLNITTLQKEHFFSSAELKEKVSKNLLSNNLTQNRTTRCTKAVLFFILYKD